MDHFLPLQSLLCVYVCFHATRVSSIGIAAGVRLVLFVVNPSASIHDALRHVQVVDALRLYCRFTLRRGHPSEPPRDPNPPTHAIHCFAAPRGNINNMVFALSALLSSSPSLSLCTQAHKSALFRPTRISRPCDQEYGDAPQCSYLPLSLSAHKHTRLLLFVLHVSLSRHRVAKSTVMLHSANGTRRWQNPSPAICSAHRCQKGKTSRPPIPRLSCRDVSPACPRQR